MGEKSDVSKLILCNGTEISRIWQIQSGCWHKMVHQVPFPAVSLKIVKLVCDMTSDLGHSSPLRWHQTVLIWNLKYAGKVSDEQ